MKNKQTGSTLMSWIIGTLIIYTLLFSKVFAGQSVIGLLEESIKQTYRAEQTAGALP